MYKYPNTALVIMHLSMIKATFSFLTSSPDYLSDQTHAATLLLSVFSAE